MKNLFIGLGLFAMSVAVASAETVYTLGKTSLEKYTIVYSADADSDEGSMAAISLQNRLKGLSGIELPIKSSQEFKKGNVINIVKPDGRKTFDYSVDIRKGRCEISGGCRWAMDKGGEKLVAQLQKNPATESFTDKGSVNGKFLFPRMEGVTLRILDDNIWDYSADTIPDIWRDAGIDCRDSVRAPEFAQIVRAYMPDVLALQEYAHHMHLELYPRLKKYGYRMAYECVDSSINHTPLFYNRKELKLLRVKYNLYTPSAWCNNGSKSYTSAVFQQKSTGTVFAIINTHLWWRGDNIRPGSTQARAAQVRLMMAEAEVIAEKFNCPIFITGDMNCEEESVPMQQFLTGGYVPCYKLATVYGNTDNGHHNCGDKVVGSRRSTRRGPDRQTGAIDHCLLYNGGDTEIKVFDCIQNYFIVNLTDHYPNLIDAAL